MVGLSPDDGEGAIKLLGEDCTDHLMGKGHPRKGNHGIAAVIDILAETIGTADDKHDVAGRASGNLVFNH